MTAANGSSDPTPTAATDSAGGPAIQLQPTPPPPQVSISSESAKSESKGLSRAERLVGEIRLLDRALVVLTLAFAFFLASFRANNSDIWMHLAAGRMIANGEYAFWQGAEPFAHTTDGQGWDNHAWLSDLILYAVAQAFGGPESSMGGGALVVLKALLVTALAGVLLLIRRPGQGFWLPAVCTSLALLAMSPRLYLQTTVVSYLFLGITLFLLQRPEPLTDSERAALPGWRRWFASPERLYALPVLFALWVNLDGWYMLGPITLALYALGELVQDRFFPLHTSADALQPGELKKLGIFTAAGFAACLLSPYHIRGLALPPELATFFSDSMLHEDDWFNSFFYASFDEKYLSPVGIELYQNVANLAFLPLLLLGVISFLCNLRGWRWWRATVFVPFAVLAALWTRAVPFFAIVAGPIAVLNFQDMAAVYAVRGTVPVGRALLGRLATALALVALLALAWPGLLHPRADDARYTRRVAWSVSTSESFRKLAPVLAELRQRGVLRPESRAFNLSPDVANYCAWYCPEEKDFFDLRMSPFNDKVTGDYVRARLELEHRETKSAGQVPGTRPREQARDTVFPAVFNADKNNPIDHVILTGQEWSHLRKSVLMRFWNDPTQWTMLYGDGRTMVFGWNDPRKANRFATAEYNPVPAAFGAAAVADPKDDEAEGEKVNRETPQPASHDWWNLYAKAPEARPLPLDESAMLRDYFVIPEYRYQQRQSTVRLAQALATDPIMAGSLATGANLAAVTAKLYGLMITVRPPVSADMSAVRLLSVRAARQAIRQSPDDPQAYYDFAVAIDLLGRLQTEMGQGRHMAMLEDIRQAQAVNALNRAITLKPDFAEAHHELAKVYAQTRMVLGNGPFPTHLESHLFHLGRWAELSREELLRSREPEPLIQQRQKQMETEVRRAMAFACRLVQQLARVALTDEERRDPDALVRRLRSEYSLKTENQPAHTRMGTALQFGLSQQALEIARQLSDADLQALPKEAHQQQLNFMILLYIKSGIAHEAEGADTTLVDNWLLTLMAAARGDYARADEHLADITARFEQAQRGAMLRLFRSPFTKVHGEPQNLATMIEIARLKSEECDMRVLRGLLALERGDPPAARTHFDIALRATLPAVQTPKVVGLLGTGSALESTAYVHAAQAVGERRFGFDLAPLAAAYFTQIQEAAK